MKYPKKQYDEEVTKESEDNILSGITGLIFVLWILYCLIFGCAYMWRNPKANGMSVIRDFKHVIKFEKLDTYQK